MKLRFALSLLSVIWMASALHAESVSWTMAIIPDSQNYVKRASTEQKFQQMTEWIRDTHTDSDPANDISLVLHEGDIVNRNNSDRDVNSFPGDGQTGTEQWQHAKDAISILDGHVPYILSFGNHDLGSQNAEDRSTRVNGFFDVTDNSLNDPAQGGIFSGSWTPPSGIPPPRIIAGEGTAVEVRRLENAYYEFNAPDGRNLLVFSLEFGPRDAALNWAGDIAGAPQYANHTAILLTHSYLYRDDTRLDHLLRPDQQFSPYTYGIADDTNDGQEIWDKLVKLNGNFEMTFNGHDLSDGLGYLASTGDQGNTVHQMLFNTQEQGPLNDGEGWLRLIQFMDDGTTVRVRTYSPLLDEYRTDPDNQFTIQLSAIPEPSSTALLSLASMAIFSLRKPAGTVDSLR
jgi:hypothetical protein